MKNIFRQSGVLDTHSTHNTFFKASVKLTAYYSAGVFLVLTLFSVFVYVLFIQNLSFDTDDGGYVVVTERHRPANDEEINKTVGARERLLSVLLMTDFVALLIIVIVSYLLSRATLRPIEESYMRQKRFVSDAAHELRTPLSVMKAGAEVLLDRKSTHEEYESFIVEALHEINYMSTMANNLLFLARRDTAQRTRPTETIDISTACEQHVSFMKSYATSRNVALTGACEASLQVRGRGVDVERLIMNLIKNAVDYNVSGGTVTVSLAKQGEKVVLEVLDTGIGIAPADIPHIFERFYKADTSRDATYTEGSGLGLSMVKEIVDEMDGTITVTSNVGKGTRVHVEIPMVV
ncbi:HAMP domain-containing histidine kinase [Candidatus Campbellbacteria bacterium]|nr:MAG: HAMP domain-containing histidine kinase [Candidatus Campbellbacteria bacterium]